MAQILYALVEQALGSYDVEQFGIAQYLYQTGAFWTILLACALVTFGHRLLERGYVWLFRPQVRKSWWCPPNPLSTPFCQSGVGCHPPCGMWLGRKTLAHVMRPTGKLARRAHQPT